MLNIVVSNIYHIKFKDLCQYFLFYFHFGFNFNKRFYLQMNLFINFLKRVTFEIFLYVHLCVFKWSMIPDEILINILKFLGIFAENTFSFLYLLCIPFYSMESLTVVGIWNYLYSHFSWYLIKYSRLLSSVSHIHKPANLSFKHLYICVKNVSEMHRKTKKNKITI